MISFTGSYTLWHGHAAILMHLPNIAKQKDEEPIHPKQQSMIQKTFSCFIFHKLVFKLSFKEIVPLPMQNLQLGTLYSFKWIIEFSSSRTNVISIFWNRPGGLVKATNLFKNVPLQCKFVWLQKLLVFFVALPHYFQIYSKEKVCDAKDDLKKRSYTGKELHDIIVTIKLSVTLTVTASKHLETTFTVTEASSIFLYNQNNPLKIAKSNTKTIPWSTSTYSLNSFLCFLIVKVNP